MNTSIVAATAVCIGLVASSPCPAGYSQPASSLGSGGGRGASAGHVNFGILGQWLPGNIVGSAGFSNQAGYLPVLGGWKVLYPVVVVNPSTLSFSLQAEGNGTENVTVTNSGGSTLTWNATVAGSAGWLVVNPSSGSSGTPLGVTASAVGLPPGTYQKTINVTGPGAVPASLLVSLTVGSGYGLTITISTGPSYGSGSVHSNPPDIACPPFCSKPFPAGSQVTLLATPALGSTFGSWGGACGGSGACVVTMDGDRSVTVNFTPDPATVSVSGDTNRYYAIGTALEAVNSPGSTVSARDISFAENVIMNSTHSILLRGGFTDSSLSVRTPTSNTTIDGSLRIRSGTIRVERINIR